MNFESIESAREKKDLGSTLFSNHISTKEYKANSILSLTVTSFDYNEKNFFVLLYKALVRPQINLEILYGILFFFVLFCFFFVWKDTDSVKNVHKKATRIPSPHLPFKGLSI